MLSASCLGYPIFHAGLNKSYINILNRLNMTEGCWTRPLQTNKNTENKGM